MFEYLIKDNKGKTINIPGLSRIYDNDIYGFHPGICNITSAKELIKFEDLVLVYEDVKDWNPRGNDLETTIDVNLLKSFSFHLGPSTQATGVVPPKSLLDHVTTMG